MMEKGTESALGSLRPTNQEPLLWRLHPVAGLPSPRTKWIYGYIELQWKHYGYHLDYHEKKRREGRSRGSWMFKGGKKWCLVWRLSSTMHSSMLRKYTRKRCMKRETAKQKHGEKTPQRTAPTSPLGREGWSRANVPSNMIKQKWNRKWENGSLSARSSRLGRNRSMKSYLNGKTKKKA